MNLEQNKFFRFQINPSFMKFQKNKKEKENEIMKRIKKIASLLLAMVMVFAMSVTAFATENTPANANTVTKDQAIFNISIENEKAGYTYEAYQIFSGDLLVEGETKTLSNIVWGEGVDEAKANAAFSGQTAREVAEGLSGKAADSDEAKAFAEKIAGCLSTTKATADAPTDGKYTMNNLKPGYYLVQNSKVPTGENSEAAFTRYIMQVVGNISMAPKSDVPTVDKKILDPDEVDTNEASIGDDVNYKIPATLPSNYDDFKTYYLRFEDTMSKGLTFKEGTLTVKKGDVDITDYFGKKVTKNADGTTSIIVAIKDLKALANIEAPETPVTFEPGDVITIYYTAVLNTDAVIAGEGNKNDVKLVYSNDPNHSGEPTTTPPDKPEEPEEPDHPTGETPKKEVVTYTTELAILKTNENGAILQGAEFTITGNGVKVSLVTKEEFVSDENGAYYKLANGSYTTIAPVTELEDKNNEADYDLEAGMFDLVRTIVTAEEPTKAVATIDADGRVTFTGLGKGTYTIEETVVPDGYNKADNITFTVDFDAENKTFSADNVNLGSNNTLETTIVNKKGSLLPSTGGIGTTIFYVVGGILVIGAGILLVTKRRMKAQ
ncbi:MAG: isopeptide-forming domain-containing fimbrial protein [Lachnospiraceae bacterium]|nr:isopeptide-forming domain-containing fimbrial protein [Lachnospiraceae bacterium]